MSEPRHELPPQSELHRLFIYDASSGLLYWRYREEREARWNSRWAGKVAGRKNKDRQIGIQISGRRYMAHRIIFKMVYGTEPPIVDHEDLDGLNNRIENLRAATKSLNAVNSRDRKRDLPRGVHKIDCGFMAYAGREYLGVFATVAAASRAYRNAAKQKYGKFARAA